MRAASKNEPCLRTLQLGMSWFPEQAGNGLDRVYYALARHLPQVGVGVRGIVAGSSKVNRTSGHRVAAFAADSARIPRRLSAVRKAVRQIFDEEPPDLVASHFALYTFPVLDLLSEKPLVVHFHGPWASESKVEGDHAITVRIKATLERAVYRRGSRFIVLSQSFRDVLHADYGVPGDLIRIVPGGVDADRFDTGLSSEEVRSRLGWPLDRPILLSVRRLARRMGLEALIDAFREVCEQLPEALLYIAGRGPLAAALKARVAELGLKQHVTFLGFVPDDILPLVYCAADLSVVPTVALEGFGLITVESLAAGTPVMVTPVGGLPGVIRDLSPELIFPDHQVETMSRRLTDALKGNLPLPGAAACKAYARTRFDWPVVALQTRKVYEEALS